MNDTIIPAKSGLALLREPFPPNQINKLPKGTKAQNDCDRSLKRKCDLCGGYHHPDIIHLDFVGHAALTDRLLNADAHWSWEPMAFGQDGLPQFDKSGGLWIRLTVCGVTRIGYGNAEGKSYMDVGSREKECIGDALRNAAMRFGAALDLWHKGQLHADEESDKDKEDANKNKGRTGVDPTTAPRGSAREVTTDAYNALDQATQESLRSKMHFIYDTMEAKGIVEAYNALMDLNLDTEGQLAMSALMDSAMRNQLKAEGNRRRRTEHKSVEIGDSFDKSKLLKEPT